MIRSGIKFFFHVLKEQRSGFAQQLILFPCNAYSRMNCGLKRSEAEGIIAFKIYNAVNAQYASHTEQIICGNKFLIGYAADPFAYRRSVGGVL